MPSLIGIAGGIGEVGAGRYGDDVRHRSRHGGVYFDDERGRTLQAREIQSGRRWHGLGALMRRPSRPTPRHAAVDHPSLLSRRPRSGRLLLSVSNRLILPEPRTEIPRWLENWKFDRFVTLATNGACVPTRAFGSHHDRLTGLLKEWDGRMNRKLAGPQWSKRPEDRMWAFYFLEKPEANPHWHGLVRLTPQPGMIESQMSMFDLHAERIWKKLVPSGTVKSLPIFDQRGVADYVAKSLPYAVSFEYFVTPDQF